MASTPSSTSRINGAAVENAFPTPPTIDTARLDDFHLQGRMSPAPRKLISMQRAQSTPPELTQSNHFGILTKTSRGLADLTTLEENWNRIRLSKKKSQYYEDAFAYREPNNSAKERVAKDSIVLAEIKLNCRVSAHGPIRTVLC
jgi:hypothetical protein